MSDTIEQIAIGSSLRAKRGVNDGAGRIAFPGGSIDPSLNARDELRKTNV